MLHRDLDDAGAGLLGEDRDETVQLAVEGQRFSQVAAHDAELAAAVMEVVAEEAAANEVAKEVVSKPTSARPPDAALERAITLDAAPVAARPLRSEGRLEETMKRPSRRAAQAPLQGPAGRPMPPALAIALVFAAAALALAAIVR